MEKEFELLILTGENNPIATRGPKGKQYKMQILGYVIKESNKLVDSTAKLIWNEDLEIKFENKTIYCIKGIAKIDPENYTEPKSFNVVEILDKEVQNEQLKEVLKNYNTPIVKQDDEFGEFVLNKRFNTFEGKINWLGNQCDVSLKCVDNLENYEVCLNTLKSIYNDLESNNKKFLEFACDKLLDTANDWNEDEGKEITREEFLNNLIIKSCDIAKNGLYSINYLCKEMFLDHTITVRGNIETGLREAVLEG